jgi:hypothetical protein
MRTMLLGVTGWAGISRRLGWGCGPPTASNPTTTTPTTATGEKISGEEDLGTTWWSKFRTVRNTGHESSCTSAAFLRDCAEYLGGIVTVAGQLESAIKAQPDAQRYDKTLIELGKMADAAARYTRLGVAPATAGKPAA